MTRGWTSRFEVRDSAGKACGEAKQIARERNGTFELNIKDEAHVDELVLMSLIARDIMTADTPVAPAAPAE